MKIDTRSALMIGAVGLPLLILLLFGPSLGESVAAISDGTVGFLLEEWLAPALSAVMLAIAALLAVAYGFGYWRPMSAQLRQIRELFEGETASSFAANHAAIVERAQSDALIGRSFAEFSETLLYPKDEAAEIGNTVRPSTFITYAAIRNGSLGLRLAPTLPGYFVGFGLLFTFAGLLAALSATSGSVGSPDVAQAQAGLGALLSAATFKFSTSIAGLLASILLSFYFRLMTASLEKNVDAVCRAIEKPLIFTPAQRLQERQNVLLDLHLAETKKFSAQTLPAIAAVGVQFGAALRPVSESLDRGVASSAAIEVSMADLRARLENVGSMLRPVVEILDRSAASGSAIEGSLSDITARLEGLPTALAPVENRLDRTAASSAAIEASLAEIKSHLDIFPTALAPVGETLERTAASGAAIEGSLSEIMERLDRIPVALHPVADTLDRTASAHADIAVSMADLRARMGLFSDALGHLEHSIADQAQSLTKTAEQTGRAADAFDRAVGEVQSAVAPFSRVSTEVIAASERVVTAYDDAVVKTALTQDEARKLVEQIGGHLHSLETIWQNYRDRFESVDGQLETAFRGMVEQVRLNQTQAADFLVKLDKSFAEAMTTLAITLDQVRDRTEDLSQSVATLAKNLPQAAE